MTRPAQWTEEHAHHFLDPSVVEVYGLRLPYPPGVFDRVADLLPPDGPRTVLDVGTGDGTIGRALARRVDRVDAVDFSPAMLAMARQAPGGDHPNIRWIEGRAEEVALGPPYGLVTCGDSLAWMDWEVVLPRFHQVLCPGGMLAMLGRWEDAPPWQAELQALIEQYSVFRRFESGDLIAILTERGLFREKGRAAIGPEPAEQSLDDYLMSWFSRAGLARHKMSPGAAEAFANGLREIVEPHVRAGMLMLETTGRVVWGRPLTPS